jgi:S-layer protein
VDTVTGLAAINKATLTIVDTAAKSVVVSGNSDLDLTAAGASLTSVNASASTGKVTFSSAVDAAVIVGGSGADTLTATGSGQTLSGGAGKDTLVVTGNLAILTGGAGSDTFNVSDATTNVNSYATITDLAAGDVIKFTSAAAKFVSAKVTLADTAVFQDLANAAIANGAQGDVAWFQYGGATYVVEHVGATGNTTFTNADDIIVKIAGTVDLSTASFSLSNDTLLIV